jgi:hypothetical protein
MSAYRIVAICIAHRFLIDIFLVLQCMYGTLSWFGEAPSSLSKWALVTAGWIAAAVGSALAQLCHIFAFRTSLIPDNALFIL